MAADPQDSDPVGSDAAPGNGPQEMALKKSIPKVTSKKLLKPWRDKPIQTKKKK